MIGLFLYKECNWRARRCLVEPEWIHCEGLNGFVLFAIFCLLSTSLFKWKCGLGGSERQHHSQGFKALPILCITVLKLLTANEHTALGVCCFEWLVDIWNCPCKAEGFQHLFLADIYKFTTLIAMTNYLCSQGGRWVMCVNMNWSAASFSCATTRGWRFLCKHQPPLQGFTNPSMQIHVQNAPFVYNPDTISVGLGFSIKTKMTGGVQYIKNISQCCVQFVVYPPPP